MKIYWVVFLASYTHPFSIHHTNSFVRASLGTSHLQAASFPSLESQFISLVSQSLKESSFSQFELIGPSKKRLSKYQESSGSLRQVSGKLICLKKNKLRIHVTFKYHLATDIAKNWEMDRLEEGLTALLLDDEQNDGSGMIPLSEWGKGLSFGQEWRVARLETKTQTISLNRGQSILNIESQDRSTNLDNVQEHDRTKNVPFDPGERFLQRLDVTNEQGKPRAGMASKLRQCQKFVEILTALVEGQTADGRSRKIEVVDMGCGRGYLTFALHHHLASTFNSVWSKGIDVRPKLVKEVSKIAESLGSPFDKLHFEEGTIEAILESGNSCFNCDDPDSIRVLIALHACDTATDDALWAGISSHASTIVVAPCCHRQVRPQLDKHATKAHVMWDVLRHNIYKERMAETLTDSLRALLLELAGYRVQVFEFIGGEHTAKNVMITAVKSDKHVGVEGLRIRIQQLSQMNGISSQKLATFMGERLSSENTTSVSESTVLSMPKLPSVK